MSIAAILVAAGAASLIVVAVLVVADRQAAGAPQAKTLKLEFPVRCDLEKDCKIQNYVDRDASPAAKDFMCGSRTYDGHNGTDIRIPSKRLQKEGVEVLAAASGTVARARDGVADISVRDVRPGAVAGTECGNGLVIDHGGGWETQYCHMERGSISVAPGETVTAGTPLGRVGLSGQTEYPHLHFTVRHNGAVVDPFAYGAREGACGEGETLWSANSGLSVRYRTSEVLNAGFAPGAVTMESVAEHGSDFQPRPDMSAPAIVAYVQALGLREGDVQELAITDPKGGIIAQRAAPALRRNEAQSLNFVGARRPPDGWARGTYRARYTVRREGEIALEKLFSYRL